MMKKVLYSTIALATICLFVGCTKNTKNDQLSNSGSSTTQKKTSEKERKDSSTTSNNNKSSESSKSKEWKIPTEMRNSLINVGGFSADFVDNLSQTDYETAVERANKKLSETGSGDVTRIFYELNQMFPGSWGNNPENETSGSTKQSTGDSSNNTEPTGEWVETFKKKLYDNYQVTPSKFKFIGNNRWEVWVNEIDTGDNPYVTVDSSTGNFHG